VVSAFSCGYASLIESSLLIAPSNWFAAWIFSAREEAPIIAARAIGDVVEDAFLVPRVPLHRLDQVRDQVGAALELVLHLAPGSLHLLLFGDDAVCIRTARSRRAPG